MTEQEAELNAIREITGFLLIDDKKRYLTRLGLVMTFFLKTGIPRRKKPPFCAVTAGSVNCTPENCASILITKRG
ncbi:hypothetical protein AB7Z96_18740 [Morganella morganii]